MAMVNWDWELVASQWEVFLVEAQTVLGVLERSLGAKVPLIRFLVGLM
jgi:hypothetical protein